MIPSNSVCQVTECDLNCNEGVFLGLLEDVRKWPTYRFIVDDVRDRVNSRLGFSLSVTEGNSIFEIEHL
jgi:hypothetical protein